MRRIYAVWIARQVASPFFLKSVALVAFLFGLHKYASIKMVLRNSPSFFDVSQTAHFFASAFVNTDAMTQVLSGGIMAVILLLARDTVKRITFAEQYSALQAVRG